MTVAMIIMILMLQGSDILNCDCFLQNTNEKKIVLTNITFSLKIRFNSRHLQPFSILQTKSHRTRDKEQRFCLLPLHVNVPRIRIYKNLTVRRWSFLFLYTRTNISRGWIYFFRWTMPSWQVISLQDRTQVIEDAEG